MSKSTVMRFGVWALAVGVFIFAAFLTGCGMSPAASSAQTQVVDYIKTVIPVNATSLEQFESDLGGSIDLANNPEVTSLWLEGFSVEAKGAHETDDGVVVDLAINGRDLASALHSAQASAVASAFQISAAGNTVDTTEMRKVIQDSFEQYLADLPVEERIVSVSIPNGEFGDEAKSEVRRALLGDVASVEGLPQFATE